MSDQTFNGIAAVVLGLLVSVVLLIPVAAIQYRRDGRLGPQDLLTLVAAAIYGLALWTYTLLPLPATDDFTCQGRQLELLGSFRPIWEHGFDGPAGLLRNPAFMQIALNVVLFVPFGFFVRIILRRGIVVGTLLGFATSLLIETTQTTGVWGLYDCPYRLFDVDDLLVNTLGACVGALLAAIFIDRAPKQVRLPTRVSWGRRMVGMVCDAVFIGLAGACAAIGYRAWHLYGPGDPGSLDSAVQAWWQFGLPFAFEAATVLALGKTVGEWTVDLRTVPRGRVPSGLARLVKLGTGIAPYVALLAWPGDAAPLALAAFAVVTVAATVRSDEHRGLSNLLAGLRLEIDQDERSRRADH